MKDQWGNDVGPGFVGGGGMTVNDLPSYEQTQQDLAAIRGLMASQGAGYMVTGNASMADGGNSTAYLPQMMNDNGIKPTTGILSAYQGVTGQEWKPGDRVTGYNNNGTSGTYNITAANGQAGVSAPTGYGGRTTAAQTYQTKPAQYSGDSSVVNTKPATIGVGDFTRSLDWSPANTANATRQMMDAKQKYGWTDEQIGKELGFTGAQIAEHFAKYGASTPAPAQPKPPASQPAGSAPVVNRTVDGNTETIEGRIGNLLATDASGNYTNPLIQQAANSAMQQFAGRGLLNSSMATEAAYQAAMSKAIEIAGPDAQTYFSQGRANQDASNVFERDARGYAQDNYKTSVDMQKFDRELQYRYDALKLDQSSQNDARALAQKYAIEMENVRGVNSAYDLYLRRISDIDSNVNYDAATKVKLKNEAGKDFDIYAKTKGIAWEMSLGNRFAADDAAAPSGKSPTSQAATDSGAG